MDICVPGLSDVVGVGPKSQFGMTLFYPSNVHLSLLFCVLSLSLHLRRNTQEWEFF